MSISLEAIREYSKAFLFNNSFLFMTAMISLKTSQQKRTLISRLLLSLKLIMQASITQSG